MNDCESVKIILQDIGYVLSDHGKEYRTRPLYRDSDNDSVLRIWKNSGQWVDFKENISGSLEDLVKITLKLKSIDEAKNWISAKGIDTSFREDEAAKPTIKQTSTFDRSLLIKLLRDSSYWSNRGISDSTLQPFQGGVATGGKMFNRYVFPIFNNKEDIIGFAGRDISKILMENRPKWKLLGDKKEWVYPAKVNVKELQKADEIIIVESIGDMLALRENKINNSIVSFGLNISPSIIYFLISLNPKKIVVAFNNDGLFTGAGNRAAETAKKTLTNYFDLSQISIKLPTEAKDFGELHLKDKNKVAEWYNSIK